MEQSNAGKVLLGILGARGVISGRELTDAELVRLTELETPPFPLPLEALRRIFQALSRETALPPDVEGKTR